MERGRASAPPGSSAFEVPALQPLRGPLVEGGRAGDATALGHTCVLHPALLGGCRRRASVRLLPAAKRGVHGRFTYNARPVARSLGLGLFFFLPAVELVFVGLCGAGVYHVGRGRPGGPRPSDPALQAQWGRWKLRRTRDLAFIGCRGRRRNRGLRARRSGALVAILPCAIEARVYQLRRAAHERCGAVGQWEREGRPETSGCGHEG